MQHRCQHRKIIRNATTKKLTFLTLPDFLIFQLIFSILHPYTFGFLHTPSSSFSSFINTRLTSSSSSRSFTVVYEKDKDSYQEEAESLLARAKEIRESINTEESTQKSLSFSDKQSKEEEEKTSTSSSVGYRLYVDIGREPGTWMDPRWGASGKRIEFTLDIHFLEELASQEIKENMISDNFGGRSSPTRILNSAPNARLRKGFDKMKCHGGGYRIDKNKNSDTVRSFLKVDGTPEQNSSYGDIFVPQGNLYFSIPCFGTVKNLSTKEGIVSVRMWGWHTGWRRLESRIVGVFRAVSLEKAKEKDGF